MTKATKEQIELTKALLRKLWIRRDIESNTITLNNPANALIAFPKDFTLLDELKIPRQYADFTQALILHIKAKLGFTSREFNVSDKYGEFSTATLWQYRKYLSCDTQPDSTKPTELHYSCNTLQINSTEYKRIFTQKLDYRSVRRGAKLALLFLFAALFMLTVDISLLILAPDVASTLLIPMIFLPIMLCCCSCQPTSMSRRCFNFKKEDYESIIISELSKHQEDINDLISHLINNANNIAEVINSKNLNKINKLIVNTTVYIKTTEQRPRATTSRQGKISGLDLSKLKLITDDSDSTPDEKYPVIRQNSK